MTKAFLLSVLLLQVFYFHDGLGIEEIYGETNPVEYKSDDYEVFPDVFYHEYSPVVENSNVEIIPTHVQEESNYSPFTAEQEDRADQNKLGLTPEEQIAKIQDASERVATMMQTEFDNLASMILDAKKRSKREITALPATASLTRFLNHIRANNAQQNDVIDKMLSGEDISEKFSLDYTPTFGSNEVEGDLDVQASENAEMTTEMPASEQELEVENSTEQLATEWVMNDVEYPEYYYETTPAPPSTPEGQYYYYQTDDPAETITQTPSEYIENTFEQPRGYDATYRGVSVAPEGVNALVTESDGAGAGAAPAQQVVFVVPTATPEPTVYTDEVEERTVTEFAAQQQQGEVPRVAHQTHATVHRVSQVPAAVYYAAATAPGLHHPHPAQYYFSLA